MVRSILEFLLILIPFKLSCNVMCMLFLKACNENGNDNIATFEEVSSCVYEMVVVSKWICSHPAYRSFFRKQMIYLLSKKTK